MFERFNEQSRHVMVLAQEEARLLNHNFIGTEHLLLGLLREDDGIPCQVLERLGISHDTVRAKVEEAIGSGSTAAGGSPPFTPRAKKVLELSLREALQLGDNHIGTEHILLGILREGEGVGARVLIESGAELQAVRSHVLELTRRGPGPRTVHVDPAEPRRTTPGRSSAPPDCPHCRSSLAGSARVRRVDVADEATGSSRTFIVVYCETCGRSLRFDPA